MTLTMDVQVWAEEQFGKCELKEKRRTDRLMRRPPKYSRSRREFAGANDEHGRLESRLSFVPLHGHNVRVIAGPHWEQTRQQPPGRYLLLDDTTEVEFGICREIFGLGPMAMAAVEASRCIRH